MKPRTLRGILVFTVACVMLLLLAMYYFDETQLPVVELPSAPVGSDSLQSTDKLGQGQYTAAEVVPDTVQAVVTTLYRTENYSRNVTVERFWSGGGSTEKLECHVRGSDAHIVSSMTADPKHTLILDDSLYIWYGSSQWEYVGIPSSAVEYGVAADEFAGMLTYEELLRLDKSDISEAGYTIFGDESCIWARYSSGPLGYISKVYISIGTGLLMGAERYDGDELIYRMSSDEPVVGIPADDWFTAPS